MQKSKCISERKNRIVRNKTLSKVENSTHTRTRLSKTFPYLKTCQHCGRKFKTHFHTQKYCSAECYANAIRNPKKQCEYCHIEFQPAHRHTKYCSVECYHLAIRTRR